MASNMFSRFLPQSTAPSVYETLRRDDDSDVSDVEERAGLAYDGRSDRSDGARGKSRQENREFGFNQSVFRDESPANTRSPVSGPSRQTAGSPEWLRSQAISVDDDEANDDVPMSLLVEEHDSPELSPSRYRKTLPLRPSQEPEQTPLTELPPQIAASTWNEPQISTRQRDPSIRPAYTGRPAGFSPLLLASEKEKAFWRWSNVANLDEFLKHVYEYKRGNGIYSIVLARAIDLLTIAFVVGFGIFLTSCIEYSSLPNSKKMSEILVPRCTQRMGTFKYLAVTIASFLWFSQLVIYVADCRRLWHLHMFYEHLLGIPERDIQTVSWQFVVGRLMALRDLKPETAELDKARRDYLDVGTKQRMDAHDIANRLMRRDNYFISMINKDILDFNISIPYVGERTFFSRTLEWNIECAIWDMLFDKNGQVRKQFLGSSQRRQLSDALKARFRTYAVILVFHAPFTLVYNLAKYFFRYFNEYQRNPGELTQRQFTPLAQWQFREFNEVPHLFEERLKMADPFATRYINQFPKDKTVQVARFVGLVAGALASVLVMASLWDRDPFMSFEITPGRTGLFYLSIFVAIWGAARNMEPEDNLVFDPEYAMETVIEYTHYHPSHWKGQLHSEEVRQEFAQLFKMKIVIFFEDLLGIILSPFILWFRLPDCSDKIVDFLREFTVHVDGLGYVCSFAVFDFQKGAQNQNLAQQKPGQGASDPKRAAGPHDHRDDYYSTRDNKMMQSYFNFMDAYVTNPDGKGNLARLAHERAQAQRRQAQQFHPPPAFPGLSAGMGASQATDSPVADRRAGIAASSRHLADAGSKARRSPRFAAASGIGMAPSPATSMLLDPQHQPMASGYRPAQRSVMQSQLRKSRHVVDDVIGEEDEDQMATPVVRQGVADSGASDGQDRSGLGGSWKTTRAGNVEGEDGLRSADQTQGDDGGVLGMVYQFSKAQTRGGMQI